MKSVHSRALLALLVAGTLDLPARCGEGPTRARHSYVWRPCPPTRFCVPALCQPRRAEGRALSFSANRAVSIRSTPRSSRAARPGGLGIHVVETLMGRTETNPSRFTGCWPNRSRRCRTASWVDFTLREGGAVLRRQPGHRRGRDLVASRRSAPRAIRATARPGQRSPKIEQTGPRSRCASPSPNPTASWR